MRWRTRQVTNGMCMIRSVFAAVVLCACASCAPARPSDDLAEEALRASIDEGDESRIRITAFTKTDGMASEVNGVSMYTVSFSAEAQFLQRSNYGSNSLSSEGDHLKSWLWSPPSPYSLGFTTMGVREAQVDDRLDLRGEIAFQKRESGWVVSGIYYRHSRTPAQSRAETPVADPALPITTSDREMNRPVQPDNRTSDDVLVASIERAIHKDLRNLAANQEIYYSSGARYRYAASVAELGRNAVSEGVRVTIQEADQNGWSALGEHPTTRLRCAIYSGHASPLPPASIPGVVSCTVQSNLPAAERAINGLVQPDNRTGDDQFNDFIGAWAEADHCMRIARVPDGVTINVWYCDGAEDAQRLTTAHLVDNALQSTDKAVAVRFARSQEVAELPRCLQNPRRCVAVWFDAGTQRFSGGVFTWQGERFEWEK